LAGVNLSLRAGEMVAVLGHNGSGKTTLVKHLNGLLRPTSGAVLVEGRDTRALGGAELGRKVGFVFQDPDHQIFCGRVFDEAAFGPRNFGFSEREVQERVKHSLAQVGLAGYEERDPFLLTKGERQRLALASVLAADPPIIIMDEPTTGLDYPAQRAVMDLLAQLNRNGRTIVVVTHTLWAAAEYARRCIIMAAGRLIVDGPTRQVLCQAEVLLGAGLRMPEVTALGIGLGAPALSVEEFLAVARREG
jgi:energy-coupling factor transport system ATP-binding protein